MHACRLNQAHHYSCALAGPHGFRKQPFRAPDGNRPDLVLDRVVVYGQALVPDETRQRRPSFQDVVQRFDSGCAISDLLKCQQHPLAQGIEHRF